MADSSDTELSELLRERLRLDAEIARYQQAVTVLFVDIVGSTRFYDQFGDIAGLTMLQKFLDKLVPIVETHAGIVVKTIGDAILARFEKAIEGVYCALDMQWCLTDYNAGRPESEQIHIRVALNCGFALIKGADVFGDVVNVCSRIEGAARPDDILMSPSVYDQICQNQEVAVRKRGEGIQLKGKAEKLDLYEVVWRYGDPVTPAPPRPSETQVALAAMAQGGEAAVPPAVEAPPAWPSGSWRRSWLRIAFIPAVLGVLALALTMIFWRAGGEKPSPPAAVEAGPPSIAVLPFVDMSPEKNQEYFSDGLAEELLNALARTPELRVTARTSSFQFKGKNEDLRSVGEKLNVGALLEGSVRKEGRRVRITVQLINAADGFHIWSEIYERDFGDIFAVQEEIASSVAASLKLKLLGLKAPAGPPPDTNAEAYNAYLQGRYYFARHTREGLEQATRYFEQAIQLQPGYAAAWAELAHARSFQAAVGYLPAREGNRRARQAAERAVELNPDLAEAHDALAYIQYTYDWDWAGADASAQRALALAPGDSRMLRSAAELAATLGRFDEALRLDHKARDLDPVNPQRYFGLAFDFFYAGRLDEAVAALKKAIELDPKRPMSHSWLGLLYVAQGRPQEALIEIEQEPELPWRLRALALANYALGRKNESDAALAELVARYQGQAAYQIAEVHAFRGNADAAFEWLERAYLQRDGGLAQMKGDPLLKPVERDPRYAAFLKKMRLPA